MSGEFDLIRERFGAGWWQASAIELGVGDDAAVINPWPHTTSLAPVTATATAPVILTACASRGRPIRP